MPSNYPEPNKDQLSFDMDETYIQQWGNSTVYSSNNTSNVNVYSSNNTSNVNVNGLLGNGSHYNGSSSSNWNKIDAHSRYGASDFYGVAVEVLDDDGIPHSVMRIPSGYLGR